MRLVLGCDPGATGAISFFDETGVFLGVEDIPVDHVQIGKHSRSRLARHRLISLLSGATGATAFFEKPDYRPMKKRNPKTGIVEDSQMGVAGAGAFGEMVGGIEMALVAAGAQLIEIRPNDWKSALRLKGDKDNSRRMAENLFPAHAKLFARKKDDGRAEASLIGYYGVRVLNGQKIAA